MQNAVDKSIDLVVCIGLVGIGFLAGGPVLASAVSGLGVNMLVPHIEHGSRFCRRRLLGSPSVYNEDIERSLRRAFVDAAGRLEDRWDGTHRGHQLRRLGTQPQADPRDVQEYEAAKRFFEDLRTSAEPTLQQGRLADLAKRPVMLRLLDTRDTDLKAAVSEALKVVLQAEEQTLADFVRANLVDELAFCFTADLKTDKEPNNRAWRGYQKLMLDGLTDTLAQVRTEQAEWTATAAKLAFWAETLQTAPPDTRDPIGEPILIELLTGLGNRIDQAIERDGGRTRTLIREGVEQASATAWETTELVVDTVEAGNRRITAQIEELQAAVKDVRQRADPFPRTRAPGSLPPIWNVPDRNPTFWPRPTVMDALEVAPPGDRSGVVVHALHGMGGVGKSQLAIAHVYAHVDDYDLVWFVPAEQPDTLAATYARLATQLDLPEAGLADQSLVVVAVRRHLGQIDARWLLVFDNAEQVADVKPYLPQGGTGRVIVTSRNPVWGAIAHVVPVEVFHPDDAIAFLNQRTGWDDRPAAGEIAVETGGLPLALDQARAYVAEEDISLARYVVLYRTNRAALKAKGRLETGYAETVATAWEVSFQRLSKRTPAGAMLLTLCAFMAPDGIPLDVIAEQANHLPSVLQGVADNDLELTEAVGAAVRLSLIQRVDDRSLAMHRLVQEAARARLSKTEHATWATVAVEVVNAAFPRRFNEVSEWPACARLSTHARAAVEYARSVYASPLHLLPLLDRVAQYSLIVGEAHIARGLYEEALGIRRQALPTGHPLIAVSLNNLVKTLWELGELATAWPLAEEALAIRQARGDRYQESVAFYNLGQIALDLRRPLESLRLFIICSHIDRRVGNEHLPDKYMENVPSQAYHLNIDWEELARMTEEVERSYRADGGWSLIRQAFPEGM